MDVFLGRVEKLLPFRDYTASDKEVYIVTSNNLNNEHNIYGYLFYKKKKLTHVIIGNNSVTKDGCYMGGLMPAESLNKFSQEDIDTVIDRIREKYEYAISDLRISHVFSRKKIMKDSFNFICLRVLVINLFITYIRGESNKIFSNKMISELISGIAIRPMEITVGQKITTRNEIENGLLRELGKSNLPLYPVFIDSSLFSIASTKCVDSYLLKSKIDESKTTEFYIFTMEDCGQPLHRYMTHGLLLGDIYNDLEAIQSLLLQILFAVINLNRYGFVHGDLHMGNVTARESYAWKNKVNYSSLSCYCEYKARDTFYVKFYGAFPTLIDFGRSKSIDLTSKTKLKIKSELGHDSSHPLELLQLCNMLDILRLSKGLMIALKTTETGADTIVKDFVQSFIDLVIANKPDKNISIVDHAYRLTIAFDNLREKKETCMSFDFGLNESMLAFGAHENRLA